MTRRAGSRGFCPAAVLAVMVLLAFGRYGLEDVDSGAPHIIGLIVAALVCALYALIAWRGPRRWPRP